ncbi:MAG: 16S rRNA (cytosine(1402)-N(4))-methyltransferase RsmH [Gammaproteobacteria bacterium]
MDQHESVLLAESIAALDIKPSEFYIDGTYGRGGHTRAIMAQLGAQGRVLAIDKDAAALEHAGQEWQGEPRLVFVQGSFVQMKELAAQQGMLGKVAGILLDLGVSSPQLATPERGFSFMYNGPLDMRMNQQSGKSAADYLADVDEQTLVRVLRDYGEERFARRIARALINARMETPITTTQQLAEIVTRAVPKKEPHKHPATRTFQALRIWVNNELEDLQNTLEQTVDILAPGGRLVVISFHSLEDRIVKQFIRGKTVQLLPREMPIPIPDETERLHPIGKAIRPTEEEIKRNPRARSAIMRVAER